MNPPRADEFEVSVFGPGYGEAVLVHLGENDWLIADSCVDQRSHNQPVLTYLEKIGVDAGSSVRTIVASHWHRDHVRGLREVIAQCVLADFWVSSALSSEALLELTMRSSTALSSLSPFREFRHVMDILRVRSEGLTAPPVKMATAGKLLYRRERSGVSRCRVEALAPSDAEVIIMMDELVRYLEGAGQSPFRLTSSHPNDTSVVLWVEIEDIRILLGADLEARAAPDRGWSAVVSHAASLSGRASVLKVPHHGSVTGYHDGMWAKLVEDRVHACITPFRNSHLPTDQDLRRIKGNTDRVYLTARVQPPPTPRMPKIMRGVVRDVWEPEGRAGHIRIRGDIGSRSSADFEVHLAAPAYRVQ